MNTNYSNIEDEYKEFTDYLNEIHYPDGKSSIQEHLFEMGIEFCKERPKFYTECESFWNFYIREFYDRMYYILNTPLMNNRENNAKELLRDYNLILELPNEVRGDIFIEYQTKIDQKLKPKSKNTQLATKSKKAHLKSI